MKNLINKQLIIVRYGEWNNDALTKTGKRQMEFIAQKIKQYLQGERAVVISAKVARAEQSAQIIADVVGANGYSAFTQLYAADEDGLLPDCKQALEIVNTLLLASDMVIAVMSREYIAILPSYINKNVFSVAGSEESYFLERGTALLIDFQTHTMSQISGVDA